MTSDENTLLGHRTSSHPAIDIHASSETTTQDDHKLEIKPESRHKENTTFLSRGMTWILRNLSAVETTGITPIPTELRTDKRVYELASILFSGNIIIGNFAVGVLGPTFFNLGLRDALIVIAMVDLFVSIIPAYFTVFGPKLGMRAMVQARYSWGYYGASLPSLFNVVTMLGYLIVNSIVGGQLLSKVSDNLNATLGIVIISLISLTLTFCGYRVMHWYESVSWIPNVLGLIIMLGLGGKHLSTATTAPSQPATISQIMTFAGTVVATVLGWSTMTPDYGVYHDANASSLKIFSFAYLGIGGGNLIVHVIGALLAAVPVWRDSLGPDTSDVGGLVAGILAPAGSRGRGAGKLLLVLMALSVPSACAPAMYSFGMSLMTVSPIFAKVPRPVLSIVATGILIPLAIVGSTRFFSTLTLIFNLVGYWCGPYAAIIIVEHVLFRKCTTSSYLVSEWNNSAISWRSRIRDSGPAKEESDTQGSAKEESDTQNNGRAYSHAAGLPTGLAAIVSFLVAIGVVTQCIQLQWFVGPLARRGTGDIATIMGFATSGIVYGVLRSLERLLEKKKTQNLC